MADTAESAIYRLQYQTGDSQQQLDAARRAVAGLVSSSENLSVTEEKVERAMRRKGDVLAQELARQDPLIRGALRYQEAQERIARLEEQGVGTTQARALALDLARQNFEKVAAANDNASVSTAQWTTALNLARGALGALGIAASVEGVISFTKNTLVQTAALNDQARVVGLSTDSLQAYRFAAIEAGSGQDVADTAIRRFTRSLGEAAEGAGPARKALQDLGFTAGDLAGGTQAFLPKVVTALLDIEDASRRARLETALFGRSGQEVEPVLQRWSAGTQELIDHFKALGVIIDEAAIDRIEKAQIRFELFIGRIKAGLIDLTTFITNSDARLQAEVNLAATVVQRLNAPRGSAERPGTSSTSVTLPLGINPAAANIDELGTPGFSGPSSDAVDKWAKAKTALEDYLKKLDELARLSKLSAEQQELESHITEALTLKRKELDDVTAELSKDERERIANDVKAIQVARDFAQERERGLQALTQFYNQQQAQFRSDAAKGEQARLTAPQRLQDTVIKQIADMGKGGKFTEAPSLIWLDVQRQMEQQVKLAGMTRKERETEYMVMQAERITGAQLTDEQRKQVAVYQDQIEKAEDLQRTQEEMSHSLASFLTNIVRTGKLSWHDLFSSMADIFAHNLEKMLADWIQTQFQMKTASAANSSGGGGLFGFGLTNLPTLFNLGGGSGFLSGAGQNIPPWASSFGDISSGDVPGFANGGDVRAGQIIRVGERGAETFVPKSAGTIVPNGGIVGSPVHLHLSVSSTPEFDVKVSRIAGEHAQRAIVFYDKTVLPDRVSDIARQPRLRG